MTLEDGPLRDSPQTDAEDVSLSLAVYVDSGGPLNYTSERQVDGTLVLTFTLLDGDRFHEILREQMNDAGEPLP